MQKVLLLLFFFLLNGCSVNQLLLTDEVDKVYVVKYSPYVKQHRAYFTRDNLIPMQNGQKYIYLYSAKEKDLGILLHRKDQYLLYSLSYPDKKEMIFNVTRKTEDYAVLKSLKRRGYRLTSPTEVGYTSKVSPRIYKGTKTFLVEVTDYTSLEEVYKKAIRTYNAKEITNIKTKLPKVFISDYYEQYYKRAKTQKQLKQVQMIGTKLGLYTAPAVVKTAKEDTKEIPEEEKVKGKEKIKKPKVEKKVSSAKVIKTPREAAKPYSYYLKSASYNELNTYLSKNGTREHLTYNQYNTLNEKLKEEKILRDGSLEEVLAAYKKNNDPRYKEKILVLMKKAQENK